MTEQELIAAFVVLECEPGCSPEDVKASYRQLVKVWHPDRFDGDPKLRVKATEKMKLINDAYRLLERFFEELEKQQHTRQQGGETEASTSGRVNTPPNQEAASGKDYKVGSEQIKVTQERDAKSGEIYFKKTVEAVKAYNGRWLTTQTNVFKTRPVKPGESFEFVSQHSMSFTMSPEQGRRGAHWDYGSALGKNEHDGTGNEYLFPDGSAVSISNVSTDTWFNDDEKKAAHGRTSSSLESMEEAYQVFKQRCDWNSCVQVAHRAVDLHGQNSWGWIQRSFALHCLKKTNEAFELLRPAAKRFPEQITIFYNLACYAAQLGNISEAKDWLKAVFDLAEKDGPYGWQFERYRKMALEDSDLISVRSSVPQTPLSWKMRKYFGI